MKKLFFISLALLIGCAKHTATDESQTVPVVAVKTSTITKGDIDVVIEATGKTDAVHNEKLTAPIAGKIVSIKAMEGSHVTAGEVVATLLTKESQAMMTGAEALLRSATTPAQKAEARRMLELARLSQNTIAIRSRFTGTVATRSVSEGDLVAENAELFTIVDPSSISFVADVPLHELQYLHTGQECTVRFALVPQEEIKGVVDAINPQTDAASQTVKVRVRFTRITPTVVAMLKTDMIGTARIVSATHRAALLVPKAAVLRNDETNVFSVVVVEGDTLARIVEVTVGASTDSTIEVASNDLHEGMPVITEGNYALADSTKVNIIR